MDTYIANPTRKFIRVCLLIFTLTSMSFTQAEWVDPYLKGTRYLPESSLIKLFGEGDPAGSVQLAINVFQRSPNVAVETMLTYARAGIPTAMYELSKMLRKCPSDCKDLVASEAWFEQAAENGHPAAQEFMAMQYQQGRGVVKDANKAYRYYLGAAQGGIRASMITIASLLCTGTYVAKNVEEGRRWVDKLNEEAGDKNALNYSDVKCEE